MKFLLMKSIFLMLSCSAVSFADDGETLEPSTVVAPLAGSAAADAGCVSKLTMALSPRLIALAGSNIFFGNLLVRHDGFFPFEGILSESFRVMRLLPFERRQIIAALKIYATNQMMKGEQENLKGMGRLLVILGVDARSFEFGSAYLGPLQRWLTVAYGGIIFDVDLKWFTHSTQDGQRIHFYSPFFNEDVALDFWQNGGRHQILKRYYRAFFQREAEWFRDHPEELTDSLLEEYMAFSKAIRWAAQVEAVRGVWGPPKTYKDLVESQKAVR